MDEIKNLPLNKFGRNIHSQNGEDGVIKEIFRGLGIKNDGKKWCVEFGAWDGIHFSNTFALVEDGWRAVYIEGDTARFQDLLATAKKYPLISPVNAFVSRERDDVNSLEKILKPTGIPKEFELLSIDIDSYDLDVWESLARYSPKVVVIEINSSVPPGVLWRHSPKTPGNTFSATLNVAAQKAYTLVCHTGNLIFVRNDLVRKINIGSRYIEHPELLFLDDWLPPGLFAPPMGRGGEGPGMISRKLQAGRMALRRLVGRR